MVDFRHVNVLPQSFFSYYLDLSSDAFVQVVAAKLNFAPSSQLDLLQLAAHLMRKTSKRKYLNVIIVIISTFYHRLVLLAPCCGEA